MGWNDLWWAVALSLAFEVISFISVHKVKSAEVIRVVDGSSSLRISGVVRVDPPPGFRAFCAQESWSCGEPVDRVRSRRKTLKRLAKRVNATVNRLVKPESDVEQYGVVERWSIPVSGRGDCEDYALLKMRMLLERGVPNDRLLLAVVITKAGERHVVLVVRTSQADLILDNLETRVLKWRDTTYRFVAIQDASDLSRWKSVKPTTTAPTIIPSKADLVSAFR